MTPLAVDLFCGLGGWTEGLLLEGYRVIGFDIERHEYGDHKYPAQLVLQDVRTIHGKQFKDAALIVASPPCQEYSYMAMPWSKAKAKRASILANPAERKRLTALFDACFRIQREASEAAGRHIPLVVENVRGAQEWVGRAQWNFGSFYLWGDVPALMPMLKKAVKVGGLDWNGYKNGDPNYKGQAFNTHAERAIKTMGHHMTNPAEHGIKQPGISGTRNNGKGDRWFQDGAARHGSKSSARKMASAMIAKIPLPLARHIAAVYKPKELCI